MGASLIAQLVKNLPAMQRPEFYPWVGKIPWRRERLPAPAFWPGEFHGLYRPECVKTIQYFPLLKTEPFLGSKVRFVLFGMEDPLLLSLSSPLRKTCLKGIAPSQTCPHNFCAGFSPADVCIGLCLYSLRSVLIWNLTVPKDQPSKWAISVLFPAFFKKTLVLCILLDPKCWQRIYCRRVNKNLTIMVTC